MGIHVVWNTIKDAARKQVLEQAVLAAIGGRLEEGHWDVKLTESGALPGWTAVVLAPNKTKVAWYFHGQGDDDAPELVQTRIEILLKVVGL